MQHALKLCADQSRLLLILGLAAGVGLPGLAAVMAEFLPQMIAILLVLTAFRIGASEAFGALSDLKWSLPAVAILQVLIPLGLILAVSATGQSEAPLALAIVLAAAAPTISGGAALAIILRQNPARVMQILVLGTALFPATILLVLWAFPAAGAPDQLIGVGLRALATIAGASAVGFALRHWLLPTPDAAQTRAIDGAVVLFFAIIVVGLMAALGPILRTDPTQALSWLAAAFALSFGLQIASVFLLSKGPLSHVAGPLALAAGNRNIALFLLALPAEITAPIMVFVACWQVPMYLTPILLAPLYARLPAHD